MMTDDEHCPVLPQSQPQGREPGRVVVGACGRPDADAMCLPCTVVSGSLALNGWWLWLLVLGPAAVLRLLVVQSNPIRSVGLCRLLACCSAGCSLRAWPCILLRAGPAASARVDRGGARPACSTLASRGQPMGDCTLRTAVCRGKVRLERPVETRECGAAWRPSRRQSIAAQPAHSLPLVVSVVLLLVLPAWSCSLEVQCVARGHCCLQRQHDLPRRYQTPSTIVQCPSLGGGQRVIAVRV